MKLDWHVCSWGELTTDLLYAILELRSEVFIVEQTCIYQDIDAKDKKAKHVLGFYKNELVAYSRIFKPGDYFDKHSFGRAIIKENLRGKKLGFELVRKSVAEIGEEIEIKISAQYHLENFYKKNGFESIGSTYLEDGIPHIAMLRNSSIS